MASGINLQESVAKALHYYYGDYYFYSGLRRVLSLGMIGELDNRVFNETYHVNKLNGLGTSIPQQKVGSKIYEPFNCIAYSSQSGTAFKLDLEFAGNTISVDLSNKKSMDLLLYFTNPTSYSFDLSTLQQDIASNLPGNLRDMFYDLVFVDTVINVEDCVIIAVNQNSGTNNGKIDLTKIIQNGSGNAGVQTNYGQNGATQIVAKDITLAVDLVRFSRQFFGSNNQYLEKI